MKTKVILLAGLVALAVVSAAVAGGRVAIRGTTGNDKVWVNVRETQDTFVNCEVVYRVEVSRAQDAEDNS